jgi:hypothetical protein
MRRILLTALFAGGLQAAAIRGVVVEHQTGHPLARALVVVQPIAGTNAAVQSVRSDINGAFEIGPLPGGAYLVLVSRRSFAPTQYGQKQWKSAGTPVVLEENAATFLNIRLQRFGSISGFIVDENDVGLQEHDVVAYKNTRPPIVAARAKTDDRGHYRVWGLEPGSYLIRTVGKHYDEGDYLPTFSRETSRVDEARPAEVQLDVETTDVHVRPFGGRLFSLAGRAFTSPQAQVTLTLVSDLGSETAVSDSQGNFKFNPTAPGPYELYAVAQADRRYNGLVSSVNAAYQYVSLDRDNTDYRINLGALPELRFTVEDAKGQPIDLRTVQILYRSKNLSGDSKTETLRPQGRVFLPPGRYDMTLAVSPTFYTSAFSGPKSEAMVRGRPDGWNEILINGSGPADLKFVLSSKPAAVHGVARNAAHDPVAGVPVFLEAYDADSHRRVSDVRTVRTDTRGQFEFYGLAPGQYRVLSTFEFQMPELSQMDAANARSIRVEEGQDQAVDLDLYVIR